MSGSICAIVGCGRPLDTKGYCRSHYRRLWRHGDPLGGSPPRGKNLGPCFIKGCDEPSDKKGMCNAHYLRMRRYGRTDPVRRTELNVCGNPHCPGRNGIDKHLDYARDPEKFKARSQKWRDDNSERYRANIARYLADEDVQKHARERTKKWTRSNPERKRAMDKAFAEANRALVTSYKAARRARVLRATPVWLTSEQWVAIRAVYSEAESLSRETGIRYDVDHIVPLQGKSVCGLHVPWNLRAIPRDKNNSRSRVWLSEHADTMDDLTT